MRQIPIQNDQLTISFSEKTIGLFLTLAAIYSTSIILIFVLTGYHIQFDRISLDAGAIAFSLTFFMSDLITETFGKEYTKKILASSIYALATGMGLFYLALAMPPSYLWPNALEFLHTFQFNSRLFIAIFTSIFFSQLYNITIFSWIREKIGEDYLWLRANLSTLIGGLFEAILFAFIAYYGRIDVWVIVTSIYTTRVILSLTNTPPLYIIIWMIYKMYPEIEKYDLIKEVQKANKT